MWLHWLLQKEKLENIALKQLFKMNMQRLNDKPKCLYQRVSAQFCDLICRVGFQKEFAPPAGNKCEHIQNNIYIARNAYIYLCIF